MKNSSDEHHCRCFRISSEDIEICKVRLEKIGFKKQPGGEQDHGQVFGLRYKIMDLLQIHFKVMPNGMIESELEPPPEYPGAHLNDMHSYSPHAGMSILLDKLGMKYSIIPPIPETCKLPTIIDPDKPLKWWEMLIIGVAAVGLGYLILQIFKK